MECGFSIFKDKYVKTFFHKIIHIYQVNYMEKFFDFRITFGGTADIYVMKKTKYAKIADFQFL